MIQGVERLAFSRYRNPSDMAVKIKVSQPIISKLLARKSNPRMDILGRLLDALGARIVFPDEQLSTVRKAVVAVFSDGAERPLCLAPSGEIKQGGVTVGFAVDAERPEAGGTGELYLWGAFTLMENTECSHGCVDCRAG